MPKKQKNKTEEKDLGEIAEQLAPLIDSIAPHLIEYQKIKAPVIKRWQYINFTVMMAIIVSVSVLAGYKIIDGSAATGLIGAVIGYVFGGLYQQRNK